MEVKDKTVMEEGKKWEFDENVAAVFDNMLERSIPQYELMRKLVTRIGSRYLIPNTYIMDIGCSNGLAIEPFFRRYADMNKFMLLDVSEPMLQKCREKFGNTADDELQILNYDITKDLPNVECSLILSILTIQFTPIEHRQKIVENVYKRLSEGGAFIFVEKVLGNTNEIDNMLVDEYYAIKSENAYTEKQIQSKRKSLEGVLVPITARWNEDMLRETGFKKIDCFWRCLNFAGWIAIK